MTPMTAALLGLVIGCALLIPAAVFLRRRAKALPAMHTAASCRRCSEIRHPSRRADRALLARIPRQGGPR